MQSPHLAQVTNKVAQFSINSAGEEGLHFYCALAEHSELQEWVQGKSSAAAQANTCSVQPLFKPGPWFPIKFVYQLQSEM